MAPDVIPNRKFPDIHIHIFLLLKGGHCTLQKGGSDDNDSILVAAKKVADSLRAKKAFTNTATFDLRCEVRSLLNCKG